MSLNGFILYFYLLITNLFYFLSLNILIRYKSNLHYITKCEIYQKYYCNIELDL